jgi:hypothetical protein
VGVFITAAAEARNVCTRSGRSVRQFMKPEGIMGGA